MKKELYIYARPNLPNSKSTFTILPVICVAMFLGLSFFNGNIVFTIILTASYLVLSLLAFLDKDQMSRHLALSFLALTSVSIVLLFNTDRFFANFNVILWTIILGIIVFICYDILVFVKIKNKLYSTNDSVNKKVVTSVSFLSILGFSVFLRICSNIPEFQNIEVLMIMLFAVIILFTALMMLQKLIIYLFVRNKI